MRCVRGFFAKYSRWFIVGIFVIHAVICGLSFDQSVEYWAFDHLALKELLETTYIKSAAPFAILAGLVCLTNCAWVSMLISTLLTGVFGLVNYYTAVLHGAPFFATEIKNIPTALAVLPSYTLTVDKYVTAILILAGINLLLTAAVFFLERTKPSKRTWRKSALWLAVCVALTVSCCVIKPDRSIVWSWRDACYRYGYWPCFLETARPQKIKIPTGYTASEAGEMDFAPPAESAAAPDVILIMNETFYDLGVITDVQSDVPYLEQIYQLDQALTGYCVVPGDGGGTNNSEYELLTGNSMYLMPSATPFNVLDMSKGTNLVRWLKSLGYDTLGTHCSWGSNYNRVNGYAKMGFDTVLFQPDYSHLEYYCKRAHMDSSVYRDVQEFYEGMSEDQPRFLYLLTYQNHGGYEQNGPEWDRVHTQKDFGSYTDDVDEFLTSIQMSDQAFIELTEYFSQVERDVIVCMVGDHGPSFSAAIQDPSLTEEASELLNRSVPFVIWSNFERDDTDLPISQGDTIALPYLSALLLGAADIAMSPYDTFRWNMMQQVPVFTTYGSYYDADGNLYHYSDETPYTKLVQKYYSLAYENVMGLIGP